MPPPLLEVRLLALALEHRNRLVLLGLLAGIFEDALRRGYRTLIISGVTPAFADGHAAFCPMALDLHALPAHTRQSWQRYQRRIS